MNIDQGVNFIFQQESDVVRRCETRSIVNGLEEERNILISVASLDREATRNDNIKTEIHGFVYSRMTL